MAWKQFLNAKKNKRYLDAAVDGDLDIAYALLLAYVQWGKSGKFNYLDSAKATFQAISDQMVNKSNYSIQRGNSAHYSVSAFGYNIINVSSG
jgi:endo-1,4-beta-D-glucanase Y